MFADVTPPLSKHGGWPRPHATLWRAPEPVRGQEEHRGLLAQGQLRRSMDPGKHTAGSAPAPSLAHLRARSALKLNACIRQHCLCDISVWWIPGATRPCGVPPGHSRAGLEHSQPQFPPSAKGQKSPRRSSESEFGYTWGNLPLQREVPLILVGRPSPGSLLALSHSSDSAAPLPLFTNSELATEHVPRPTRGSSASALRTQSRPWNSAARACTSARLPESGFLPSPPRCTPCYGKVMERGCGHPRAPAPWGLEQRCPARGPRAGGTSGSVRRTDWWETLSWVPIAETC